MSTRGIDDDFSGNSELDWEIFDVLCRDEFNVSAMQIILDDVRRWCGPHAN